MTPDEEGPEAVIIAEACAALEAAGFGDEIIPHVLVSSGLTLLEVVLCRAHYIEQLTFLRDTITTRIAQARSGAPVGTH